MASGGYMDNVRVKIAEKYKPPPRINLPITYSQRINLNKQIQDTFPNYEFVLEKTVLEKMKEWRVARSDMFADLKTKVERARRHFDTERESAALDNSEEIEITTAPSAVLKQSSQPYSASSHVGSMLIPTQAIQNSYGSILKPIPLSELESNQNSTSSNYDKSPFNISDFEADTSSPFDNMELKSINEMEELAQVLKLDRPQTIQPVVSNYSFMGAVAGPSPVNTYLSGGFNQGGYGLPLTSASSHYTNGYYYPPETIQSKASYNLTTFNQFNTNHNLVGINNRYSFGSSGVENSEQNNKIGTINTVPHIIKSLENELDNTHLDNIRKKNLVMERERIKCEDSDFSALPKNLQDMSKKISLMGFPLSRVARVCKALGDDQKKVVDHLLAMSELLDLGFPENKVSKALMECDNDRDKALDILIS